MNPPYHRPTTYDKVLQTLVTRPDEWMTSGDIVNAIGQGTAREVGRMLNIIISEHPGIEYRMVRNKRFYRYSEVSA